MTVIIITVIKKIKKIYLYKKNKKNKQVIITCHFIYIMCVKPLKGIVYGINPVTGKKQLKVVSDSFVPSDNDNVIPIPCGKCIECRLNKSKVWADRMMAEASYYTDNVFLTLTYDDDHLPLPLVKYIDQTEDLDLIQSMCVKNGLPFNLPDYNIYTSPIHPLNKRDVQLFMKKLRWKFKDRKIRFYACGEYGDKSFRPHYHLILFNLRLEDAKLLYTSPEGFSYFTSDTISSIWDKGLHILSDVNWNTCNYVARYVTKKLVHGYDDLPEILNYPREFSLMSRKPGIGYQWYQDHKDTLNLYNESYISDDKGSKKISMNKYFDSLLELEDIELYNDVKAERLEISRNKDLLSTLPFDKRNENKRLNLEAKTTLLRNRKEI